MNISSVGHSYAAQAYTRRSEPDAADTVDGKKQQAERAVSPEQLKELQQLKARDREVRVHEMAHLSAAGGLATSGATFTYQRGPETIRKAQTIRAAALAPAEPSGQDRAVAAQATQMETQARAEQAAAVDNDDEQEQEQDPGAESSEPNIEKGQVATEQYQNVAAEFKSDSQLQVWA